jgi:hypothetical protein
MDLEDKFRDNVLRTFSRPGISRVIDLHRGDHGEKMRRMKPYCSTGMYYFDQKILPMITQMVCVLYRDGAWPAEVHYVAARLKAKDPTATVARIIPFYISGSLPETERKPGVDPVIWTPDGGIMRIKDGEFARAVPLSHAEDFRRLCGAY